MKKHGMRICLLAVLLACTLAALPTGVLAAENGDAGTDGASEASGAWDGRGDGHFFLAIPAANGAVPGPEGAVDDAATPESGADRSGIGPTETSLDGNPIIRFVDSDDPGFDARPYKVETITVDDKTPLECVGGIVPKLPGVHHTGYYGGGGTYWIFDGYADEDGNPVKPGDKIDHDVTLHPTGHDSDPTGSNPGSKPHPPSVRVEFRDDEHGTVDDKTPNKPGGKNS